MAFTKDQLDEFIGKAAWEKLWQEELWGMTEPQEDSEEDEFFDAFSSRDIDEITRNVSHEPGIFLSPFDKMCNELRFTDTDLSDESGVEINLVGRLRTNRSHTANNMDDTTSLALALCQRFFELANLEDEKRDLLGTDTYLKFDEINKHDIVCLKRLSKKRMGTGARMYSPLDHGDLDIMARWRKEQDDRRRAQGVHNQGSPYIIYMNDLLHNRLKNMMMLVGRGRGKVPSENNQLDPLKIAWTISFEGIKTGKFMELSIDSMKRDQHSSYKRDVFELLEKMVAEVDRRAVDNDKYTKRDPDGYLAQYKNIPVDDEDAKIEFVCDLARKIGGQSVYDIVCFERQFINECLTVAIGEKAGIPFSKDDPGGK